MQFWTNLASRMNESFNSDCCD